VYPEEARVTTTFVDSHAFALGGRRFELYSTPGGETLDSLIVWMPDDRTVFIGNLMGPMFGHVPNLYTIRGDKVRSAVSFLNGIDRVLALEPEVLFNGHFRFAGRDSIRETLMLVRAATQSLRDQTIEGMNAGRTLWELMESVTLPDELTIPQLHGKVPWIVRAIYEEHVGWFRYESTTELYSVPPSAVWPDIVAVAGAGPLCERARVHAENGRPLQAIHLAEIVLAGEPGHPDALDARQKALETLLERSGQENFSEVQWLKTEIAAVEEAGSR
jgi:alkyl sulfatase BDS1-like metallo-beta-lactamase superfamily hydrolase